MTPRIRRPLTTLTLLLTLCLLLALPALAADPPSDAKKQTPLGKYLTALEAFEMWKGSPEKIKVLDCRTWQEYAFVGHAPMAYNVPSKLFTGQWDPVSKSYPLADNPGFEAGVKKLFQPNDPILVMCRSGQRSADSVKRLAAAGFTNLYNIIDGFEGDTVADPNSYFQGKRMANGWKNSGAPWIYSLDPKLAFAPAN